MQRTRGTTVFFFSIFLLHSSLISSLGVCARWRFVFVRSIWHIPRTDGSRATNPREILSLVDLTGVPAALFACRRYPRIDIERIEEEV